MNDINELINADMEPDVAEWLTSCKTDSQARMMAYKSGLFNNVNRGNATVLAYIPEFACVYPEFEEFGDADIFEELSSRFPQVLDLELRIY